MHRVHLLIALFLLSGCPTVKRIVFRFDPKALTGELRYLDIGSDGAENIPADFQTVVGSYLEGNEIEIKHPGWMDVKKELVEEDGKLNGVVRFRFDNLAGAGVYQHKRNAPYLFCAQDYEGFQVRGNGTDIGHVIPGCMAWERKTKVLELTLMAEHADSSVSLVDVYRTWKATGVMPAPPAPAEPEAEPTPEPIP